jgi:hypothetical protein
MKLMHDPATGSADSLSPFGERAGVRGLLAADEITERLKPLTPPLSLWEREQAASVVPAVIQPHRDLL